MATHKGTIWNVIAEHFDYISFTQPWFLFSKFPVSSCISDPMFWPRSSFSLFKWSFRRTVAPFAAQTQCSSSNVRSEFQHRSIKSLLFNCGVGVGMATFRGLYSAVLHLDFILALTSTSSDCHVYLTAICKEAFCRGGGVRRTPAPRARRRREQPVWENVCGEPFTVIITGGGLGI